MQTVFTDGSELVAHGAIAAGVDVFVGYPITPASGIFAELVRRGIGFAAPDEITAVQYLIGASLNGHKAMTATSAPGFLLMTEGIGAAFMMEAPLVVVLVQRLGPATGSATMNAQGDLALVSGVVSGGFTLPVFCPSAVEECAELTVRAVNAAEALRVPVVLLTEKDMVTGKRSVDFSAVRLPAPVARPHYTGEPAQFQPYGALDERGVPAFRPLFDPEVQVRITASTHDAAGQIRAFNERVRADTERLQVGPEADLFPAALVEGPPDAAVAVLAYGHTCYAARAAVRALAARGVAARLIAVRTLFPILTDALRALFSPLRRLVVAEENLTGQYATALRGAGLFGGGQAPELVSLAILGRAVSAGEIEAALTAPAGAAKGGRP